MAIRKKKTTALSHANKFNTLLEYVEQKIQGLYSIRLKFRFWNKLLFCSLGTATLNTLVAHVPKIKPSGGKGYTGREGMLFRPKIVERFSTSASFFSQTRYDCRTALPCVVDDRRKKKFSPQLFAELIKKYKGNAGLYFGVAVSTLFL